MFQQSKTQTQLFEQAKQKVPGGVHSPVRSFKGLPTTPLFFKRGEGAYIYDVDDRSYIDFCMSFGPLIAGHRHPQVEESLHLALQRGWSFGACEPYSLELANLLIEQIPFIEQIRFVNSGTEAVMTALRLARGATKRNKILKFNGCYHGHSDSLLIKAGSGLAGTAEASSSGVPQGVAQDTLIAELGDTKEVEKIFAQHLNQIAAIIVEPLPANNGLLVQDEQFLHFLRKISTENGTLLIFDEVISGLRVGFGGMAQKTSITPDLVTYGKIIGGGLPVGALAGPTRLMQHLAPVGTVYQAGTLSANPLAMAGGLATLKLCTESNYKNINQYTQEIVDLFKHWLKSFNNGQFSQYNIVCYDSLFWFVKDSGKINSLSKIPATLTQDFTPLFMELLERGIYLAPNAYEVSFASLAHGQNTINDLKKRLGL